MKMFSSTSHWLWQKKTMSFQMEELFFNYLQQIKLRRNDTKFFNILFDKRAEIDYSYYKFICSK